jgi:phage gp37-like protein
VPIRLSIDDDGSEITHQTVNLPPPPPQNSSPPGISGPAVAGQVLQETHGGWSEAPSSFAYQWYSCDKAGNNCSPVPGALGQAYALTSRDTGTTLRVTEAGANASGIGVPAQSAASAVVVSPPPPANVALPVISGQPLLDQPLAVSQGTWSGSPGAFAYQWQSCDGTGTVCTDLAGATGSSHTLNAGDVGHRLRAEVTASSPWGSAMVASTASAVIGARINASLTWRFQSSAHYTLVESLVAQEVPPGASIYVTCRGGGCPFARDHVARATSARRCPKHHRCKGARRRRPGEVDLSAALSRHRLHAGTMLSVEIVKEFWVGQSYAFTMRPRRAPLVNIACLAPGSQVPGLGC